MSEDKIKVIRLKYFKEEITREEYEKLIAKYS